MTGRVYPSPSAAIRAGACPHCLGGGDVFDIILERRVPCSRCDGTGDLEQMFVNTCDDPDCPDHGGAR